MTALVVIVCAVVVWRLVRRAAKRRAPDASNVVVNVSAEAITRPLPRTMWKGSRGWM